LNSLISFKTTLANCEQKPIFIRKRRLTFDVGVADLSESSAQLLREQVGCKTLDLEDIFVSLVPEEVFYEG